MCGILGTINIDFGNEILDLIRHRGPDASGIEAFSVSKHNVCFGHRRLSIVDLSPAGAQPMVGQNKDCCIVFNGEVYNHADLKKRLSGIDFKGHSDTETLLYTLKRYGIESIADFNGIFAFAFFDLDSKKLFLARDPFGVKPLYYWHSNDRFVFSSELKPILKLVDTSLCAKNLAELLRMRYLPAPDTLFSGIHKVKPGHLLEIDLSKDDIQMSQRSYIRPIPDKTKLSYIDARFEYGRLFEQAVRRQLMSDVEVGVLLSGGVDSALVAHMAQKHLLYKMKAFTVGFDKKDDSDEISDAAETAEILGLDHKYIKITIDDFFGFLRKGVSIVEEPLATTSLIPMYYLSHLASSDVKVVLTGQGADEPLGGYGRYQGEVLSNLLPSAILAPIANVLLKAGLKNEKFQRGLYALSEPDIVKRFLRAYTVFRPSEIRSLTGIEDKKSISCVQYFYDLLFSDSQMTSVEKMMSLDMRMNLADDLLLYTDKITMSHSLECRVPILDMELVRFIESLPGKYRIKFKQGKMIHKDFARSVLPGKIVNRKKKGFQSPTKKWFKDENKLREVLLDKSSLFTSYFDTRAVEKIISQHQHDFNKERHLFLLLAIRYWMDEFLAEIR